MYIYGKLILENATMWSIIRSIVRDKEGYVFGFGPCRLCKKKCALQTHEPCREKIIFAMERVGLNVAELVEQYLQFKLEWLDLTGTTRLNYLSSVVLAFIPDESNPEEYIINMIVKDLERKMKKIIV